MSGTLFAFDLDGTITQQELLPLIATELGLMEEIKLLTHLTLIGSIPFEDSFRLRCAILKSIPVSTVQQIVSTVTLDPHIEEFILQNPDRCSVVTGNLRCWIQPLITRLKCDFHCSEASVEQDRLASIGSVLNKGRAFLSPSFESATKKVAIGDSYNDIAMFEVADVGVAFGGVHKPVAPLIELSNYVVFEGKALCRLLSTL